MSLSKGASVESISTCSASDSLADAVEKKKAWKTLSPRAKRTTWKQEEIENRAVDILSALPEVVVTQLLNGSLRVTEVVRIPSTSLSQKHLVDNYTFVKHFIKACGSGRVPSVYYLADVFLALNELMNDKLLTASEDPHMQAVTEANRMKRLLSHLKMMARKYDQGRCKKISDLKTQFLKVSAGGKPDKTAIVPGSSKSVQGAPESSDDGSDDDDDNECCIVEPPTLSIDEQVAQWTATGVPEAAVREFLGFGATTDFAVALQNEVAWPGDLDVQTPHDLVETELSGKIQELLKTPSPTPLADAPELVDAMVATDKTNSSEAKPTKSFATPTPAMPAYATEVVQTLVETPPKTVDASKQNGLAAKKKKKKAEKSTPTGDTAEPPAKQLKSDHDAEVQQEDPKKPPAKKRKAVDEPTDDKAEKPMKKSKKTAASGKVCVIDPAELAPIAADAPLAADPAEVTGESAAPSSAHGEAPKKNPAKGSSWWPNRTDKMLKMEDLIKTAEFLDCKIPPEAYPAMDYVGVKSYTVYGEDDASIMVLWKREAFWMHTPRNGQDLPVPRTFSWKKYGGAAKAWEEIKQKTGFVAMVTKGADID
eukprot:TRINITY_DN39210_c0_g3_i1.p1 TRINITY_DN39210_c0_g3~~TRINITY_DN39210_c0_g3_i1.p1  ORF type:complete len:594 (-),score=143.55 TRINITY_DN39210_c0_g3_i1:253-2034(-)